MHGWLPGEGADVSTRATTRRKSKSGKQRAVATSGALKFVGRNIASPRALFHGARSGESLHGLTNGSWSSLDATFALLDLTGPAHLTVATWTAGTADLSQVAQAMAEREFLSVRMLLDRSFPTRQPKYCAQMRSLFGEHAIRLWDCHAKFTILQGEMMDVLYLTSANLNRNRRLENFSVFFDGPLPREYLGLCRELWEAQGDGSAFDIPSRARRDTRGLIIGSADDQADVDFSELEMMSDVGFSELEPIGGIWDWNGG